jgi:ribonuclease HI
MSQEKPSGKLEFRSEPKAHAYTDGASGGSRGPGGYGAVLRWKGEAQEISGGEQNTTNQRRN